MPGTEAVAECSEALGRCSGSGGQLLDAEGVRGEHGRDREAACKRLEHCEHGEVRRQAAQHGEPYCHACGPHRHAAAPYAVRGGH
ncbi:MAG: hypothetical protein M5U19_19760 [Microthrixaceae bacterium]|nr:hypothetical protein [Microthrixaceae bacterium]